MLPAGQEKVLCSTTTSVDALAAVIVPHGGDVSFSSAADSATPLMAFLRIICQRVKGPGYVDALQMILSRTPASPSVMPLLRASPTTANR